MTFLPEVIITADHTDATPPVYKGNGVFELYSPSSPETAVVGHSTELNLHCTITVPPGYNFIILPLGGDLPAAPKVYLASLGCNHSTQGLKLNMVNFTADAQTPTAEAAVAYLVLIPNFDYEWTNN